MSRSITGLSPWVTIPRLLYQRLGVRRGVGRIMKMLAHCLKPLQLLPVRTNDGRVLCLDLRESVSVPYLVTGEMPYDAPEAGFVRSLLRERDVAIDIGANVGWYSTLLCEAVGEEGKVYAFEPSAEALRMLCATARAYPQLRVMDLALGEREGAATMFVPQALLNGSLRPAEGEATRPAQSCRMTTLDLFLEREGIQSLAFVKCDVEGGELDVLRGAAHLLSSERPPIWMVEINLAAAQRFGYHPDRLFEVFQSLPAGYHGYRLDARRVALEPRPAEIDRTIWNAVFVPACHAERVVVL